MGVIATSKNGAGRVWFWTRETTPTNCLASGVPTIYPTTTGIAGEPTRKNFQFRLGNGGTHLAMAGVGKLRRLSPHTRVACWCDNTPTVAWASRLLSTKAKKAARLLRILALRMIACQASPLTTLHIEGKQNQMADFASRSFAEFPKSMNFLTEFHRRFPLPQNASWIEYHFPTKIIGRVLSTLSTETPALGSWRRLGKRGSVTGGTGLTSFPAISIHTFRIWMQKNGLWSCKLLLDGQGRAHSVEGSKFKPEASRQPSGPSPRPSNWLAGQTRCTNQEVHTTMLHSQCKRKATDEKTPQRGNKWQCR